MNTGRDIIDVYKKINENIPNEYTELKEALREYIANLWNKAPEIRRSAEIYISFANILHLYITNNEEKWVDVIKDIFQGKIPV